MHVDDLALLLAVPAMLLALIVLALTVTSAISDRRRHRQALRQHHDRAVAHFERTHRKDSDGC